MKALFECDQCGNQEWRRRDREPWLCVVCGYMRWAVVTTSDDRADGDKPAREPGKRSTED
jgi:ribosomal protein L37AE/L43A